MGKGMEKIRVLALVLHRRGYGILWNFNKLVVLICVLGLLICVS